MTGDSFLTSLRQAIAPVAVASMQAPGGKLFVSLTDGRVLKVDRNRVRSAEDASALAQYVTELVS